MNWNTCTDNARTSILQDYRALHPALSAQLEHFGATEIV